MYEILMNAWFGLVVVSLAVTAGAFLYMVFSTNKKAAAIEVRFDAAMERADNESDPRKRLHLLKEAGRITEEWKQVLR